MNKKILANEIRNLADKILASSPFNMNEIELELYHNYDKLHDILLGVKEEINKYFDEENTDRDPMILQNILDDFDEDMRKLPRSTDNFYSYLVQADSVISSIYDSVQKNDLETLTELKADLDLLAGKVYAERQKIRQK